MITLEETPIQDTVGHALEAEALVKSYGAVRALEGVSLRIRRGEVYGILGPNGAGKTTLIRLIAGIMRPDSGHIRIPASFESRQGIRAAYLPEERGIYTGQTVERVVRYFCELKGNTPQSSRIAAAHWIERLGLSRHAGSTVEKLSKGNQQKVQIAAALAGAPPLIILDEPMSGLDPINMRFVSDLVVDLAREGHTVLLSTHQMGVVEDLCSGLIMLYKGRPVLQGTLAEIRRRHSTRAVSLETDARPGHIPAHLATAVTERGGRISMTLRDGVAPSDILVCLESQGKTVTTFRNCGASLEEIFIQAVNNA